MEKVPHTVELQVRLESYVSKNKPQLLVALVSFKLLLAARRLSIFSPEVVVSTDPFLSILGLYTSAVIRDVAFLTVKVCTWKISVI